MPVPTDLQKARELFLHAVGKLPPEEWDSYVAQVAGDNAELRHEVMNLLKVHREAGSFLQDPAVGPTGQFAEVQHTATVRPDENLGAMIGPYKLLEQIGEGGFGVVYLAEQTEPVRRKVALKILKPGIDTRQIVARFEAERQALAIMDHPNIAKVFDGGTTGEPSDHGEPSRVSGRVAGPSETRPLTRLGSPRPFFVMELVKGVPITEYCDQNHLTPRQRLELFIPVCQAVQHAHQKGIIHRDLKPSNVLVSRHDSVAVPKVIDFGVAKALGQELTDKTLFTGIAQMIGTPLYMSPEQAGMSDLDVDTRSDIYSLGVLLYELLTGTTPFEKERFKKAAYDEIRRIIREEEPPKPSTRLSDLSRSRLPGETVDSPARQAGPTSSLASVSALRQTEPAKLTKLVRGELDWIVMKALEKDRNRRYETANAFLADVQRYLADEPVQACPPAKWYRFRKFVRRNKVILATAAIVAAALLTGTAVASWQAIVANHAKADAVAAASAENQAKLDALARDEMTRAVLDFVENKIFAAARPEGHDGGLGHDVSLRKALETALPFVERNFSNRPLIEARLRMTLGISFVDLGDAKIAVEQFEKALALRVAHLGRDHQDTLRTMAELAGAYDAAGRGRDALRLREETLQLMKAKLGPDHPDTLAGMSNLAISYTEAGRAQEALKLKEETLELMKAKLGLDNSSTLSSMNNLAISYYAAGRLQDALKLTEETIRLKKAKFGPDHPDVLGTMNNLANLYLMAGRTQNALELHEETLRLKKAKFGLRHQETLQSMDNLATVYAEAGRLEDALKLREETLKLRKAELGPRHSDTLASMSNLAESYRSAGRTQDGLKLMEEALDLMKAELGPTHADTLIAMNNLAHSYIAAGEVAKALAILHETLTLRERRAKAEPENRMEQSLLAWTHGQTGEAEQAGHNYAAAVQAYGRSVEMFERIDQAGALKIQFFRERLGNDRRRLALCRKAEQAVKDLNFALKQPAAEVPRLLDLRVRFLLKERRLPAAVESATKMKEGAGDKADRLYDAACAFALCAGAKESGPGSTKIKKTCLEEALSLLNAAVAKGYNDAAHMKKDTDLDALRHEPDFQKLLARLEGAKKY